MAQLSRFVASKKMLKKKNKSFLSKAVDKKKK